MNDLTWFSIYSHGVLVGIELGIAVTFLLSFGVFVILVRKAWKETYEPVDKDWLIANYLVNIEARDAELKRFGAEREKKNAD